METAAPVAAPAPPFFFGEQCEFPGGTPLGTNAIVFDDNGPTAKVRLNRDEQVFEPGHGAP